MRAVDFAVSQALPEDMRRESYDLGKKGMAQLMAEVASKHPDQFPTIVQKLGDLGRRAAWLQGYSTTPEDTQKVIDTDKYYAQMDAEIDKLRRDDSLTPVEFEERRDEIMTRYSDIIEKETMQEALKRRNGFALAVESGARGNPSHVKAILSTPGIFQDSKGRNIPLFVRNSFGEGVRPAETLAGTYGARTSVVSTKKATAKGGDLLKQMTQSTVNYGVTEKDCGVENGTATDPRNPHVTGRVLAKPVGDIPAGTVVDRALIGKLRSRGKPVMVRSPMTCQAKRGLCAKCAGVQADGKFPNVGDSIGVTAAQAIGEPIVQGALNVKHCLSEGTLVRMADMTLRPIEQVAPGEEVLGSDIHGNTFPVEVLALHDQGRQEVQTYVYKMEQTKERIAVTCTADHPLLQTTYYTGCKEEEMDYVPRKLPAGREVGKPSAVLPLTARKDGKNESLASALGYYLGDGNRWNSTKGKSGAEHITVSCACEETVADLKGLLGADGLTLKKSKRSHDWRVVLKEENRGGGARNSFKSAVKRLGMADIYCHEKTLPDEVWQWSDDSVIAFIGGYLAADGSAYRSGGTVGVSFSSTSRALLEGLRDLLRVRLCIYSCPTTRTSRAGQNNYNHDMWAFTITRRDQVKKLSDLVWKQTPGNKGAKLRRYVREADPSHYESQPFYKAEREAVAAAGTQQCWDITVDHPDELFVLGNSLIVKNTGGMAKGKKSFAGLNYITQFLSIPEEFKDRAAVSEVAGTVEKVEEAPQGGTYIHVNGEKHFALPGFQPLVKPGEKVEAGDPLSDGLINPADIVRLQGLGAGRKYYAERLSQMLRDSGQNPDARNVEILARAALDNYLIKDPEEDSPWLPDDLVRENEFLANYSPPSDTEEAPVSKAVGKYLQSPALHHTVGTKLTPKMVKDLKDAGVERVSVSMQEPWFRPEMKRLRVASHDSDDWMASLGTSYLGSQMRGSLERGDETNYAENYHFGPRLAYGADAGAGAFGENIEHTGKF